MHYMNKHFIAPQFNQTELDIIQIMLEQKRDIGIVKEFIITDREEIEDIIDSTPEITSILKRELSRYEQNFSESVISSTLMSIEYKLNSTVIYNAHYPLIIGFGGLDAVKGIYK